MMILLLESAIYSRDPKENQFNFELIAGKLNQCARGALVLWAFIENWAIMHFTGKLV